MSEREPTNAELLAAINVIGSKQDAQRTELMARMDRLQDTATQQGRDISALLDLMGGSQEAAKESRDSARRAVDISSSNTSVLTDLVKRVRQLEAEVRELKEPKE